MKKLIGSLGLVAVLAGACSGSGGSSLSDLGNNAADTNGTTAAPTSVAQQADNSGGAPAVSNSNPNVPSDFPMPVPDWAQIDSVQSFESTGVPSYVIQISMEAPKAQETADAIRAFYKDQGLPIDDSGSFIMAQNSEVFSTVTVIEAGDRTSMILSWAPA